MLYENIGKNIIPRSASLVLVDIVGAGNLEVVSWDAEYDDYEEYNRNEGHYPVMLHKCEIQVWDTYKDIMRWKCEIC